jgi:hypothetical protein
MRARTLVSCIKDSALSFTLKYYRPPQEILCGSVHTRDDLCARINARTTTNAAGQQQYRRRVALRRGPAYKTGGYHFRAEEESALAMAFLVTI